jgi:ferredoxin
VLAPLHTTRLLVDPVACEAVGLCSHLAPTLIDLDRWGYPIMSSDNLTESEVGPADRAVRGCPHRALHADQAAELPHPG